MQPSRKLPRLHAGRRPAPRSCRSARLTALLPPNPAARLHRPAPPHRTGTSLGQQFDRVFVAFAVTGQACVDCRCLLWRPRLRGGSGRTRDIGRQSRAAAVHSSAGRQQQRHHGQQRIAGRRALGVRMDRQGRYPAGRPSRPNHGPEHRPGPGRSHRTETDRRTTQRRAQAAGRSQARCRVPWSPPRSPDRTGHLRLLWRHDDRSVRRRARCRRRPCVCCRQ